MSEFGTDIYCINGDFQISPSGDLLLVDDRYCLIQDIINRLKTAKGSHFRHSDYGIDLYQYIKAEWTEDVELEILTLIEDELEKDPRILEASAFTRYRDKHTLEVEIKIETIDESPLNLVITLDKDKQDFYFRIVKTVENGE